jgi:hypothetical protein
MDAEKKAMIWRFYGWFSGLMTFGSCIGTVTWAALMQVLESMLRATELYQHLQPMQDYNSTFVVRETASKYAVAYRWRALFDVAYATEFFCLSIANLIILDRMLEFATSKSKGRILSCWIWGSRIVLAVVASGNFAGLVAFIVAAVLWTQAADQVDSAIASSLRSDSKFDGTAGRDTASLAEKSESIQYICEVAVLMTIIAAFVVVGFAFARRVNTWMSVKAVGSSEVAPISSLRKQVLGTTIFIFVSFLIRSGYSVMRAIASLQQDISKSCPGSKVGRCDPQCYNMYSIILRWMELTPEFQLMIVLVSSPFALLVALWGMTSERTLQYMQSSRNQKVLINHQLISRTQHAS